MCKMQGIVFGAVVVVLAGMQVVAAPVISNMSVTQRDDGSGLVDILYDLSGGVGQITLELLVSSNNGATWDITPAPANLSGDIGTVTNGTGKHIIWNFALDRPDACLPDTALQLHATDEDTAPDPVIIMLPGNVPMEMVAIPAGTFMMGRYPGEQDSYSNEDPQHSVTLTQGFYMGKYEVTQQQWLAVMGSWPSTPPSSTYGLGDTYPAYYISWYAAQNFITALNTHITNTGQGPATVRLPSEAEWEYACRAGTTTRFYWGDDPTYTQIGSYAWYTGNNSPNGSKPVGGKLPNAFGLYDMSGNLWEWCQDWYGTYPSGSVTDPTGPTSGSYRLLRGGSWSTDGADYCRSAGRGYNNPDYSYFNFGFRVARTP